MEQDNPTDPVDTHYRKLLDGIRFIALEPSDQQSLCPPFMVVQQLVADYLDTFEHADAFQRATGAAVLEAHGFDELRQLVRSIEQALKDEGCDTDDWTVYASTNSTWIALRRAASELLARHGWAGEIDVNLYRYSDPATGKCATPCLDERKGDITD